MGKLSKLITKLDPIAVKPARIGGPPVKGAARTSTMTQFDEYVQQSADMRAEPVSGNAAAVEVRTELQLVEEEALETRRQTAISDPSEGFGLEYHQTQSPEEFTTRLKDQMSDPEVRARMALELESTDEISEIHKRIDAGYAEPMEKAFVKRVADITASEKRHRVIVDNMYAGLNKNARWKSNVDEWIGDSPYKGEIQFHIDVNTDPLRSDTFIQYESPREIGLHTGTAAATEGILRVGAEDLATSAKLLNEDVEQLANFLEMPPIRMHKIIAGEVQEYMKRKFLGGGGIGMTSAEWGDIVDDVGKSVGTQFSEEANKMLVNLKRMPTPNSTPMVFRGKHGILLRDEGGFKPKTVANQLQEMYPDDIDVIQAAVSGVDDVAGSKGLQQFIESKGFDHAYYVNTAEDAGNISIINWNPDLMKSVYDADFVRGNPNVAATQATAAFMASVGLGSASIRED